MENKLKLIVKAMDDKITKNIKVLDIRGESSLCDYFVVGSAPSERQVEAIADEVEEKLEEAGYQVYAIEGKQSGDWILLDAGDIIVHVFQEETRNHYDLEGHWHKATQIDVEKFL